MVVLEYLEIPPLRRNFPPHSRKSAANKEKCCNQNKKRRNTVCFPGISAAFPPISAAFPPISAANRGVQETENKLCRNSKKTPQIRKKYRKSKKTPFFESQGMAAVAGWSSTIGRFLPGPQQMEVIVSLCQDFRSDSLARL